MGYFFTQLARIGEATILSIGAHLSLSVAGIFFFGFPITFGLGAYAFGILVVRFSVPFGFAVAAALGISFVLGILFALLYRRLSNDSFAVFTLAGVFAFEALLRSWDGLTGGVLGISGVPRPDFARTLGELVVLQAVLTVSFLVLEYVIFQSSFGRTLQAHKESKTFLSALGYPASRIGSVALVIAACTSAIAGILSVWRIQFLDPSFGGIAVLLLVVTISIIALKPKASWLFGATLLVLLLPEMLRFLPFPSEVFAHVRLLVYSVLLIVLVKRLSGRHTVEQRLI